MTEKPFIFESNGERLFGFLHQPEAVSGGRQAAFVMSHPFAEEKLWSHRVFVSMARSLAARGCAVLRFDYTGAGDSSGATSTTSLETHLVDLQAAVGQLQERFPVQRVGLIGLRLGASIAALLAERAATVDALAVVRNAPLVLWEPVIDGESYFQEILRSNLSTQMAVYGKVIENREALQEKIRGRGVVNVDGYEIGKSLFESAALRELVPLTPKQHGGPVQVVQIAASAQAKHRDDVEQLAASYRRGAAVRVQEQPFWREIKPFYGRAEELQRATLGWLEQHDA